MLQLCPLYIFGAGGFGSEVEWLACEAGYDNIIFVDDNVSTGTVKNEFCGRLVISRQIFLEERKYVKTDLLLAVGDPSVKKKIFEELKSFSYIQYPVLAHSSVRYDKREGRVVLDQGSILCPGTVITTDVALGKFVHVNLNCTIGHNATVGDFSTLSPGVHVSGRVNIGQNVFVGTGAVILPRVSVGDGSRIGAGAAVTKDVPAGVTVIGVPAKIFGL